MPTNDMHSGCSSIAACLNIRLISANLFTNSDQLCLQNMPSFHRPCSCSCLQVGSGSANRFTDRALSLYGHTLSQRLSLPELSYVLPTFSSPTQLALTVCQPFHQPCSVDASGYQPFCQSITPSVMPTRGMHALRLAVALTTRT